MDDAERQLFEQAVRRAAGSTTGASLDAALAELGWRDALAADRRVAVAVLFEAQGAAGATSTALDDVVRAGLALDAASGAVVLPALGEWGPPGAMEDGLCVNGLGLHGLDSAEMLLVVAETDGGQAAVTLPRSTLARRPIGGLDPRLGLVAVVGDSHDHGDPRMLAPGDFGRAVDHARLALAHELVGAAAAMLELARAHALDRVQFGRPIASFQAVRHRLADTYVAIEGARALADAAWEGESSEMTAMAKAVAGRTARLAARHCQQVLAGIGFTTEHSLHQYVKRVLVLDELFGSARVLTRDQGQRWAGGEPLPEPVPL